jgi:hypothetical protein
MDGAARMNLAEAVKDPVLTDLLVALMDNPEQKKVMLDILKIEPPRRRLVIQELVRTMGPKGAAPEFIRAWSFLMQDEIAEAAKKALQD